MHTHSPSLVETTVCNAGYDSDGPLSNTGLQVKNHSLSPHSTVRSIRLILILPREATLIILDHNLRTLHICLLGRDPIQNVCPLPFDVEHDLPVQICSSDDLLSLKPTLEPNKLGGVQSVVQLLLGSFLLGRFVDSRSTTTTVLLFKLRDQFVTVKI